MRVDPHEWDQCPYKRDPRELPQPFCHVGTQRDGSSLKAGRGPSPEPNHTDGPTLDLNFQSWELHVSAVYKPLSPHGMLS